MRLKNVFAVIYFFVFLFNPYHGLAQVSNNYYWTYGSYSVLKMLFLSPDEACTYGAVWSGAPFYGLNVIDYSPPIETQKGCQRLIYLDNGDEKVPFWQNFASTFRVQCATGQRYFLDLRNCLNVSSVSTSSSDYPTSSNNPVSNGETCNSKEVSGGYQNLCGNPINPGNGNKIQREVDYGGVSGGLTLSRTYNGNPHSWDAYKTRGFGTRWTHPYEVVLKQESAYEEGNSLPSVSCYARSDNGVIFCEVPKVDATGIPEAISILRGDGKKFIFNRDGTSWANDGDVNGRITAAYSADGSSITGWTYVSASGSAEIYDANGVLVSIKDKNGRVEQLTYSTGETNDSSVSRYPSDAPVCSNVPTGDILAAGRLLCVTDEVGRQLQFEYDNKGRVLRVINPVGGQYLYAYDGVSGGCTTSSSAACSANNLTSVTYPDGSIRTYHYNESAQINGGTTCTGATSVATGYGHLLYSLTGITDENGVRYASWTYDCQGRATSSEHAGGVDKVSLAYGSYDSSGNGTTTVTHYTGDLASPVTTTRSYNYQMILGVAKNVGIDEPCVECGDTKAREYDANGNVATRTDFNGNVTTYSYDLTRNLETQRVEASGKVEARTISTSWHSYWRLPVKVAEPKKLTIYKYNGDDGNYCAPTDATVPSIAGGTQPIGVLCQKTEQATTDVNGSQGLNPTTSGTARVWKYTYDRYGQVLTATDPNNHTTTNTYYAIDDASVGNRGNLHTSTNAAGHTTTYSNYDANGRVGTIVDANGLTTTLTYSPRGWLTSKVVAGGGTTESTTYTYDGVGQMTKVCLPDASEISYVYDDAHRLTTITDKLGNSINYTLDAMGNRTKEEVKDPTGNLSRQVTRVYDALNRLAAVRGDMQ